MNSKVIICLFTVILLLGCKREDPEFNGPSLTNIFGDFSILEDFDITNRSIDFEAGQTSTFTAQFSKEVDWEVHVTGLNSGSKKIIQGFSATLDASNANWNGTTTELPLFNVETCAVELRIPSDSVLVLDTLVIVGNRNLEGFLITDFENGIDPGWQLYNENGANMSFSIADDIVAAQGSKYYDMGGEVSFNYFMGDIQFPASVFDQDVYPLISDPAKVFFNVMLYLPEGISNEIVLFQFREDDNNDGIHSEGAEDVFSLELKDDLEPGWQLISIRYVDLSTLINGAPAAPIGNGLFQPNKITKVSCLFLADPSTGYSQTFMDYLVFTENGPLQP